MNEFKKMLLGGLMALSIILPLSLMSTASHAQAATSTLQTQANTLLTQIKTLLENYAIYLGLDPNQPNLRPQTNATDRNAIEKANGAEKDNAAINYVTNTKTYFNSNADQAPIASTLTGQAVHNLITTLPECTPQDQNCLTRGRIMDYFTNSLGITDVYAGNNGNEKMLNFATLITPSTYQTPATGAATSSTSFLQSTGNKPGQDALNFITFLAEMTTPLKAYTPREWLAVKKDKATMQRYLLNLRSYAALMSVGLNNLLHIFQQRVPVNGLGTKAGMSQANVSPRALEKYMANYRLDKSWHQRMEKETPFAVQKQMLFLLAEMNQQLFKERQQNERIIATLSTLQLETMGFKRSGAEAEQQQSPVVPTQK